MACGLVEVWEALRARDVAEMVERRKEWLVVSNVARRIGMRRVSAAHPSTLLTFLLISVDGDDDLGCIPELSTLALAALSSPTAE